MMVALPIGVLVFILLVFGIEGLPMHSSVAVGLGGMGQILIDTAASVGDIVQLPVTVPLYLIGQNHSLALMQQEARHDRVVWLVSLAIWAGVALLTPVRENQATGRYPG